MRHLLQQGKEEDPQTWRASHRHSRQEPTRHDQSHLASVPQGQEAIAFFVENVNRTSCANKGARRSNTTTCQTTPYLNTCKRTGSTCVNSSFIELWSVRTPVFQDPALLRRLASYLHSHFCNLAVVLLPPEDVETLEQLDKSERP